MPNADPLYFFPIGTKNMYSTLKFVLRIYYRIERQEWLGKSGAHIEAAVETAKVLHGELAEGVRELVKGLGLYLNSRTLNWSGTPLR